ncbi:MAG: hypothetical protein M3P18_00420 [Actinomycetota bacterium]|nr:hypothetical protein [Actinomycetota bacterium]
MLLPVGNAKSDRNLYGEALRFRGYTRGGAVSNEGQTIGLTKLAVLLAFTIAGYNLECIRSFNASMATTEGAEGQKPTRTKRRRGTWVDILAEPETPGPTHLSTDSNSQLTDSPLIEVVTGMFW